MTRGEKWTAVGETTEEASVNMRIKDHWPVAVAEAMGRKEWMETTAVGYQIWKSGRR